MLLVNGEAATGTAESLVEARWQPGGWRGEVIDMESAATTLATGC